MIHSTLKFPVFVILVPVRYDNQDQDVFCGNWALEAVEAVADAAEINGAGEFFKALKTITVDLRVFQVLEFKNFRGNFT